MRHVRAPHPFLVYHDLTYPCILLFISAFVTGPISTGGGTCPTITVHLGLLYYYQTTDQATFLQRVETYGTTRAYGTKTDFGAILHMAREHMAHKSSSGQKTTK